MSGLYNFDCHHYNGYTGCCDKHGGDCHKRCKDFITEDKWIEAKSDSDLRISVAKLRRVLSCMKGNLLNDTVIDKIIEKVKSEI